MSEVTYQQIKCKCLNCGLHFVICTDDPDRHTISSIYCPECGQNGGLFMVWRETVSGFIYETVPGHAQLSGIGILPLGGD